jgi:hypothetical protein
MNTNLNTKGIGLRALLSVCGLLFGVFFCFAQQDERNPKEDTQLTGRWELCTVDGEISKNPNVRQKVYVKNSYVVLEVDKNDHTTYIDFVGKIDYNGEDKLTETVIYTDSRIKNMLSRSFRFFYKIEGEYLYLKGIDNSFNEIWVKVSD